MTVCELPQIRRWYKCLNVSATKNHARLECEPQPNGLTLVRVYEDEQEVTREAVSNMDTP